MEGIAAGALAALTPQNLLFCFIGCFVGTLIGVLPGIGPIATISLLLPLTIGLDPLAAIITISGIYYGAAYGGSTTSILVNIPGEASTVVTCLDGYQMARQGRAGAALAIAAIGSFFAGTVGTLGIGALSEALMGVASRFGPPEYFALMLLGVVIVAFIARGSFSKSLTMVAFGVFLSQIGQDIITGEVRYTADIFALTDGVGLVPLSMGLFGVSEILFNLEQRALSNISVQRIASLMPTREDLRQSFPPMVRGSFLGFLVGLLPGGGPTLASFASYALERKISKRPEQFGRGAIAGVAGPESANNAAASGSFIPLFTLGLPSNAAMALLLGAFTMYGIVPGPTLIQNSGHIFWGVIASMYIGNLMLLLLNLPLVGLWVKLLRVPYEVLFPAILLLMVVGAYVTSRNVVDIYVLVGFGVVGYVLRKLDYDLAPLILAYVLGNPIETTFRQTLMMGHGSFELLLSRPLAVSLLLFAAVILVIPAWRVGQRSRRAAQRVASEGT